MLERACTPFAADSEAAAWAHFWKHGGATRCVPNSACALRLLSDEWREFARSLPNAARLLDLGTGLGHVLDEIARERADVRLVGVDSAPSLRAHNPRIRIESPATMEQLPFAAAEFDAVCSQFGFEYGETRAAAREIARVLRPGGDILMLVHHADSAIVAQSRARRAALEWVVERSGMFDQVARLTNEHRASYQAMSASFAQATDRARELGLDPVAPEVAAALNQIIATGSRGWIEQVGGRLARVTHNARQELVIRAALERVALDAPGVEALLATLRAAGLQPQPPEVLEINSGMPLAWRLRASKEAS